MSVKGATGASTMSTLLHLRLISQMVYELLILIEFLWICIGSNTDFNYVIWSQFCTCSSNRVAVACIKLWPYLSIIVHVRAMCVFIQDLNYHEHIILTCYAVNTGWWDIDIHSCYSLVKISFVPISACNENQQKWLHNNSISCSRHVTDQLWWCHNAKSKKSEKTTLSNKGKRSAWWSFLTDLCVHEMK